MGTAVPENLARAIDELTRGVGGLRTEVQGERADRLKERKRDRRQFATILLTVVLAATVAIIWNRYTVNRSADQLRQTIQADCPQHKALGESEIQPWTSQFGRDIVEYNRRAYEIKCLGRDGYGPLKSPDPDLARPIQPSPPPIPPPR